MNTTEKWHYTIINMAMELNSSVSENVTCITGCVETFGMI